MILSLATRFNKPIATALFLLFYLSLFIPCYGFTRSERIYRPGLYSNYRYPTLPVTAAPVIAAADPAIKITAAPDAIKKITATDIDGPGQPEMASFKPTGVTDMVNLFTGDFSYNIPLLDVGGYPVNLFYNGGVSMEQDASWVGLGWNINPGNVNRSMRGVPDDFNGTDTLTQRQVMKPNKTWGVRLGADFEFVGIKELLDISIGGNLGVSFNNYLGPSIDLGLKGGVGIQVASKVYPEKSAPDSLKVKVGVGLGGNLNSRYGLTLSPNVSLSAKFFKGSRTMTNGLRLATSYNSRTGIKDLQLSDQTSFNRSHVKSECIDNKEKITSYSSTNSAMLSSTISFTKPSYIPAMRTINTNEAWSGHFQLGGGIFGGYGSAEVEVYGQRSEIAASDVTQRKPMVGYLYFQNAVNNRHAVMDFSRLNDNEVTSQTPIISAPQYSYDIFSVQGEGTGGTIRAYRNDMGYVRDNYSLSKDKNLSIGADIGIPGHFGANFSTIKTPSTIGEWESNNQLKTTAGFGFGRSSGDRENVYLRSPGEPSVLHPNQFDSIGGTDLVRFKLGGTGASPSILPTLQRMTPSGTLLGEVSVQRSTGPSERKKRTQVVSFLTAEEASVAGLDTMIKSYDPVNFLDGNRRLNYESFSRVSEYRLRHHISQINVTEADGKRYVYGLPVYNLVQKDYTFTVGGDNPNLEKVGFNPQDATTSSDHVKDNAYKDGFVQINETPPYAHSFLLTGLLSPDYVDVNGDGITEDDLGTAVKFNYTRIREGGPWAKHRWRTPLDNGTVANFNAGNRTESKDDKGIVSYGERESWYMQSIESKTMIAFFTLADRQDGNGTSGEFSGINGGDNSLKCLQKIDLYSKADLKKNGLAGAKPIKTVTFTYNYTLCNNVPNSSSGGKLTLEKVSFSYNGQTRANKNQYVFSYGATTAENPNYQFNAADRWGQYKPSSANPQSLPNSEYPYTIQSKTTADQYAAAWSLRKILLPSGGQIEVDYESDDYAFVQNKRAAVMMELAGFGRSNTELTNQLFTLTFLPNGDPVIDEHDYIFIKVPEPCANAAEVYRKYLDGNRQLSFKLAVNMPKGIEYITAYAIPVSGQYGVYNSTTIWVKVNRVDGIGALSLTAIEYLREHLPGQAFPGYDVSGNPGIKQVGEMLAGMLNGLKSAFKNIPQFLRGQGKARLVTLNKSFVRLNDPDGIKYGGGHRVKTVKLKDNWKEMNQNQLYTSVYGQEYDYTTTETFNGVSRTISSGVASYEPSIGGEENPFQSIVDVVNQLPLGPSSYGAIETPVLDGLFPAPLVGYSKVTVRSLNKNTDPTKKSRSGIGKQVSEFYTAKDFPVQFAHTPFDPSTDKQHHTASLLAFFYKTAFDSRALSQGFLVSVNDMHGKLRSQSSYAENDLNTRVNYTENFYRNTGVKGLNEKFDFAYGNLSGEVRQGNMGIDIELMTDVREFSVKSKSLEVQAQVDLFPVFLPIWLPFIWPVVGNSENTYRAITTTKMISYHAVLDSVVVIDKGSQVSTKNLIYDAETGTTLVTRTNNEFDKPVYTVTQPAYWAYSGMGLAYKNIDASFTNVNLRSGKIISGNVPESLLESGDELYLSNMGTDPSDCGTQLSSVSQRLLWVVDKNKNATSLNSSVHDYVLVDKNGKLYTKNNVSFKIIRSGKRNMLGVPVAAATVMADPVVLESGMKRLKIAGNHVVTASAAEFREKWLTDNDVIRRYQMVTTPPSSTNLITNPNFSSGNTGFTTQYNYNPSSGWTEGTYTVGNYIPAWHSGMANCSDHTGGSGNMLLVNGSTTANRIVWSQTVPVIPNSLYNFSAWLMHITYNSPASLRILINGVQQGTLYAGSTCYWNNFNGDWNSGSSTSATITLIDNNTVANGNDFAVDDISFKLETCGTVVEVEDCNGYLEQSINPYRKGLLGNFKGYKSLVYYGDRNETNPQSGTNLPQNGFLNSFQSYWSFNPSGYLVPDYGSAKWVWNSQVTRYNSKGMELETKDAMNIFTAAQYGYNKTTPVAITSNSRFHETGYEGFEDLLYSDYINSSNGSLCAKRHFNLSGIPNTQIIRSDSAGFDAHSGKYVMKLAANATGMRAFPIADAAVDTASLTFGTDTTRTLYDVGVNIESVYTYPYTLQLDTMTSGSGGMHLMVNPLNDTIIYNWNGGYTRFYNYSATTSNYYQITEDGIYTVNTMVVRYQGGPYDYVNMGFTLFDMNGHSVPMTWVRGANGLYTYRCCLKKGIYKLYAYCVGELTMTCEPDPYGNDPCIPYAIDLPQDNFDFFFSDSRPGYRTASTQNGCIYSTPIVGSESLMNPTFTAEPGKKMLFSAWVKDNCAVNASCPNSSQVRISYNNGVTQLDEFVPTGARIEGWQRYEGYFVVPAGASQLYLSFINNSNQDIYFDDVRVHPYQANMKSYVYDPVSLRLVAEQDANNYTSYYEYDAEGILIRTKAETKEGIKTINETRSAKQRSITTIQ